jgi:hypothetical protein
MMVYLVLSERMGEFTSSLSSSPSVDRDSSDASVVKRWTYNRRTSASKMLGWFADWSDSRSILPMAWKVGV